MAPLHIGVMMESIQFADIACIDILGNLSTDYVKSMGEFDKSALAMLPESAEMVFHYISTTLEPASMTPSMKICPNVTYDDAPRNLDILVIGGPMLSHRPPAADRFMKEAAAETKLIMTTCVGSLWLASAGVLDGRKATTNRGALPVARALYPQVEWLDQRWVVDGKFWTAGGAGAGNLLLPFFAFTEICSVRIERGCLENSEP